MNNEKGFTLLELMVTTGIIVIIGGLALTAMVSSNESVQAATTASLVQSNVRETLLLMNEELQLASKVTDDSLNPPLNAVTINQNPAPNSPVEIVFQVPRTGSGRNWSRPIRYRYINEDANDNNLLDDGEDTNGDGALTRRIFRLQDLNGDGDFDDPGESRPLGTSNDLSDVQFVRNGDVITVTLTARKIMGGRRTSPVTATATGRIYLLN
jgi:prepilin-type N-terminal cleavage/methylation domain-containing protein